MEIKKEPDLEEKLKILSDAAKYDVACTSSGVDRKGEKGSLGNSRACGICHSFAADGRCISLLKVLLSNHCIYDCKYCLNRRSNQRIRTSFTPEELCTITIEFYKRNYIEGLFLSSGVIKNPTYTMELMYRTLFLLRNQYHFRGYIHAKAVPGAAPEIIQEIGYLADRMSVNMELPTEESLRLLAPGKSHEAILRPMGQIQQQITDYRLSIGKSASMERHFGNQYLAGSIFSSSAKRLDSQKKVLPDSTSPSLLQERGSQLLEGSPGKRDLSSQKSPRPFAPAGQSTQMIIGATQENDYQLLKVTQAMYQHYDLKRVFFSAYIPLNEDRDLPSLDTAPPLLREHRLYQADWLLRYYGFQAEDLLSPSRPNFNIFLDPKCDWALRHLELFPIEVSAASYQDLLKVPGIGNKSAWRILQARRFGRLDFSSLKTMGVVLKRAQYFITCHGKMRYRTPIEEILLPDSLREVKRKPSGIWSIPRPTGSFPCLMTIFWNFPLLWRTAGKQSPDNYNLMEMILPISTLQSFIKSKTFAAVVKQTCWHVPLARFPRE